MKVLSTSLGLVAAVALSLSPAPATAQRLVPPGNSAVNQYTETIPTGGGDAQTGQVVRRTAKDVIGPRKTQRLEASSPAGGEVADIVAATAPPTLSVKPAKHAPKAGPPPGDRSGLGRVIAEATGSSDTGELGALLPLLLLCALLGSATYYALQLRRAR